MSNMASKITNVTGAPYQAADESYNDASTLFDTSLSATDANGRVKKRTKTGCMTCRKRRVKCGEEKPQCSNCVKCKKLCEYGSHKPRTDGFTMTPETESPSFNIQNADMLPADFQTFALDSWAGETLNGDDTYPTACAQSGWPSQLSGHEYPRSERCMSIEQGFSSVNFPTRSARGSQVFENTPKQGCICQQLRQLLLGAGTPRTPRTPSLSGSDSHMMATPLDNDFEWADYFSTLPRRMDREDLTPELLSSLSQRMNLTTAPKFQSKWPNKADFEQYFNPRYPEHRTHMEDMLYAEDHMNCRGARRNAQQDQWLHGMES